MRLGPHTIVIRRAAVVPAEYGTGTTLDWNAATDSDPVTGCSVQPLQNPEITVDRDNVTTRWTAWVPFGIEVTAYDRVVWDGEVYEIDGDPQPWPFGSLSHLVLTLHRSHG